MAALKYTEKYVLKEGQAMLEWFEEHPDHLYMKQFTQKKQYSHKHFSDWAKKYPKFADILEKAHEIQEWKLLRGGLHGDYTASVVIFALKNVAGWRDSQDLVVQTKTPLIVEFKQAAKVQEHDPE